MNRVTAWLFVALTLAVASARAETLQPYQGDARPPALELPGLDGRAHSLADYKGQVVLVNFWATWCPPCVHEMPSLARLAKRLHGRPFVVLAVNVGDSPAEVRAFLRRIRVDLPVLLDQHGNSPGAWKVYGFPTSFLIDREGKIRYAAYGAREWDARDIVAIIERLLPDAKTKARKPPTAGGRAGL